MTPATDTRLIGREVRINKPGHLYHGCVGIVVAREGDPVVDIDGDWMTFAEGELEVLPAPTPRSQRFFAWFFGPGLKWIVLVIAAAIAWRLYTEVLS